MGSIIKKAVFPVGGMGTRFLPATKALPKEMLPIVDKPLIHYAVEEAISAGVEEFIFVTGRGKSAIEDHFDQSVELENLLLSRSRDDALESLRKWIPKPGAVAYTRQQEPLGLGHAVWCARHLIGNNPFAVLLADDIFHSKTPCLKQMVESYNGIGGMVAVEKINGKEISNYGVIDIEDSDDRLMIVNKLVEKPKFEDAPSNFAVVGRYILTPIIFKYLDQQNKGRGGEIQLTDALSWAANKEPFYGLEIEGERFDCGNKSGYVQANIAFALDRDDLSGDIYSYIKEKIEELT
ncbi:UTP--glucose-1-phosphate uridylyltransferase GalU [Alphaproteobacteria bacterium]|nr:UTP--glucose-1-phosphate uridylyltransferase GalU [Alphaproteobacteria bacterium]